MPRQLHWGQSRHALARRLFFANQGAFRIGDYAEIMNKASCRSLLSNAVRVWNTVQRAQMLGQLRATGEVIPEAEVARVLPLTCVHIISNGTYLLARATKPRGQHDPGGGFGHDVGRTRPYRARARGGMKR